MEKLPSEILCIILSFLDKKSRKSATATCQLWFDVIRNSNLSNHICFKGSVEELQGRIENLEWDWKRWPALKSFELQGYDGKEDLLNDLPIEFKQCPTLEIVIFGAHIYFADLFPNFPRNFVIIDKLAFNPQLDIAQVGVDHIWSLKIIIWQQGDHDEVLKMIYESVKGLKELSVCKFSHLDNLVCKDALLKLHIMSNSSSELKIAGLKKLKTLKVCKLAQLDNLVGMDALLELSFMHVTGNELKEYDLSNIVKHFKNLQKFDIVVDNFKEGDPDFMDELGFIQPEEYAKIVQDVFQNSAISVKIVFEIKQMYCSTDLTKEPFERCVVKEKNSYLDSDDSYDSNMD
jgi:hypothetical protein